MFDLRLEGPIARLTLDRPASRNAIPLAQWSRLADAAAEAERSAARLLLLEGSGKAFCAGADISEFPDFAAKPEEVADFRTAMKDAFARLRELAIPTVAVIEGPCFGAGVALAMACDLRVAGEGASFAITPAKFGISYPQIDIHRLVSLVGSGQAARLLLSGAPIDAAEALRIGLCELPAAELESLVAALLAGLAPAIAVLKRGLRLALQGVAADEEQARLFDALLSAPELATRLPALRGKH
jgi:enoyl-CoA hydratase/carnithine racemase